MRETFVTATTVFGIIALVWSLMIQDWYSMTGAMAVLIMAAAISKGDEETE